MSYFSENLRYIREKHQITQINLAQQLDISRQTYLNLENGDTEPRYSTLILLSQHFSVPIDYWFDEGATLSSLAQQMRLIPPHVQQKFIETYHAIQSHDK